MDEMRIIAPPIEEQPGSKPKFGRLKLVDVKNLQHPISEKLRFAPRPPSTKRRKYRAYWQGDQGYTSECTIFTLLHWFDMGPISHPRSRGKFKGFPKPLYSTRELYCRAQTLDPWPGGCRTGGGNDYDGTSSLAAMKLGQELGIIQDYSWEYENLENVIRALLCVGPVMIGVNWYEGMELPSPGGRVKYNEHTAVMTATGNIIGGHQTLIDEIDLNRKGREFGIFNSWGPEWGVNGRAYVSLETMEFLLKNEGDFCLATEVDERRKV